MATIHPTATHLAERHEGHEITVLGPLPPEEYDLAEVGPMFRVRCLEDGDEFDAFGDEVRA